MTTCTKSVVVFYYRQSKKYVTALPLSGLDALSDAYKQPPDKTLHV